MRAAAAHASGASGCPTPRRCLAPIGYPVGVPPPDEDSVAINRAVAMAETRGPAAALAELEKLADHSRLAIYQPYWAARAELLARTGDRDAALEAYGRAIGLEPDPAVRRFLQRKREACREGAAAPS